MNAIVYLRTCCAGGAGLGSGGDTRTENERQGDMLDDMCVMFSGECGHVHATLFGLLRELSMRTVDMANVFVTSHQFRKLILAIDMYEMSKFEHHLEEAFRNNLGSHQPSQHSSNSRSFPPKNGKTELFKALQQHTQQFNF